MSEAISILNRILNMSRRKGNCLVCYLSLDKNGYSQVSINYGFKENKLHRTTRVIMHLLKDFPLNSALEIHHNDKICISKACIELDHLHIGDAQENARTRKDYDNNRKQGPNICSKHKIKKSVNSANRQFCRKCHKEAQQKYTRKQNQKQNKTQQYQTN